MINNNIVWWIEIGKGKLTVGKIYGGLLILENWKTTKFGKLASSDRPVSISVPYQVNCK